MNNKLLKKIAGIFGYKLIEKDFIKNQRLISEQSSLNLKNTLNKIFKDFNITSIIQIGANDGDKFDELKNFISSKNLNCILVEPIKKYFDLMTKNYSQEKNFIFENSAISVHEKTNYIFSVKEKYLERYSDHVRGISSFNKSHVLKHNVKNSHIEKIKVNTQTIGELINKYQLKSLDLLYVDAEGYDGDIVLSFLRDNNKLKPIIIFEYIHIKNSIFKEVINEMELNNYSYFSVEENLVCHPKSNNILF